MWVAVNHNIELDSSANIKVVSRYSNEIFTDLGPWDDKWHHIVVSRSNNFGHFYVDGSLRQSLASPPNLPTDAHHCFTVNGHFFLYDNPAYKCAPMVSFYQSSPWTKIYPYGAEPYENGYINYSNMRIFERQITQEEVDILYFNKI